MCVMLKAERAVCVIDYACNRLRAPFPKKGSGRYKKVTSRLATEKSAGIRPAEPSAAFGASIIGTAAIVAGIIVGRDAILIFDRSAIVDVTHAVLCFFFATRLVRLFVGHDAIPFGYRPTICDAPQRFHHPPYCQFHHRRNALASASLT